MVKMFGEGSQISDSSFMILVEFSGNDVHFGAREGMKTRWSALSYFGFEVSLKLNDLSRM
jgi:hypothetical protein